MTAVYSEHACRTEPTEHNDVMLHTSIEKQVVNRDKCRRMEIDCRLTICCLQLMSVLPGPSRPFAPCVKNHGHLGTPHQPHTVTPLQFFYTATFTITF